MEFIFHEKQSGSLCAQHCLNALLQGQYYTVFDLAEIARSLDESERQHMAERGFFTHEYQEFLKQPSSNFDDSGFFSIQVIVKALEVLNLELLPITSSDEYCRQAREHPSQQVAFICNFRQHWFTVRKIGFQWFNLNSVLSFPELISDTYLSLFLKQLQVEGYSIFVLRGELPACEADDILKVNPVVQTVKPTVNNPTTTTLNSSPTSLTNDDPELKWVMEESKKMFDDDDEALNRALQLSASEMYENNDIASFWSQTSATTTATVSATSVTSASEMSDTQPTTSATSLADIQPTTAATIATDTSTTTTSEMQPVTSVATTSAMQPSPTTSTTTIQSASPSPTSSPSSSEVGEIRRKRLEYLSKQTDQPPFKDKETSGEK